MKYLPIIAITAAIAFACLPGRPVLAHAAMGLGVDVPLSSTISSDKDNYASLSNGQLTAEFAVQEKKDGLHMELKLTNPTKNPFVIDHRCGQSYDFFLLDKKGTVLYRWSDKMAFTQALTQTEIPADASVTYTADIPAKEYRAYKEKALLARASITDTSYVLSLKVPHRTHEDSSPVTFHGGISIGSGSYHDW